jgi:hypothetical protein
MNLPNSFNEMVAAMLRCEQTKGQTVYQHGQSVQNYLFDLIDYLQTGSSDVSWRLPDWIFDYKLWILANLYDADTLTNYALYHDAGKPFCRVEQEGKVSFPNHAQVSAEVWAHVGGDATVGRLIKADMDLHTLTSEQLAVKCQEWSAKDAATLLLAAFAEIHSNARMFGGQESVSFKQKFKHLDRRGKQICKSFCFGEWV